MRKLCIAAGLALTAAALGATALAPPSRSGASRLEAAGDRAPSDPESRPISVTAWLVVMPDAAGREAHAPLMRLNGQIADAGTIRTVVERSAGTGGEVIGPLLAVMSPGEIATVRAGGDRRVPGQGAQTGDTTIWTTQSTGATLQLRAHRVEQDVHLEYRASYLRPPEDDADGDVVSVSFSAESTLAIPTRSGAGAASAPDPEREATCYLLLTAE